jgi:hypothetical protein
MNPHTYLVPILGVFVIEITKDQSQIPIHLILMRNVRDFDRAELEEDDIMYSFDIKGQVKGSKQLENPRELLILDPRQKDKYSKMTLLD